MQDVNRLKNIPKRNGKKLKHSQLVFERVNGWGGRRKGAGRKNKTGQRGHLKRAPLKFQYPVHVTLRLRAGLPSLRRKEIFPLLRKAVLKARKSGLLIVHYGFLSNHIHIIVEPQERSLTRPLRSLAVSFAKMLNHKLDRSGAVFRDRYHMHVLVTPLEVKNAMAYVLTNEARHYFQKHNAKWATPYRKGTQLFMMIDPYSSATSFKEWRKLFPAGVQFGSTDWEETHIDEIHREIIAQPRTWLLREGWKAA